GESQASDNLTTGNAKIKYNSNVVTKKDLIGRIGYLGYVAKPKQSTEEKGSKKEKELEKMKWKVIISALLSAPLLVTVLDHLFGINLPGIFMTPWFQLIFAAPVQFILGWQFYVV